MIFPSNSIKNKSIHPFIKMFQEGLTHMPLKAKNERIVDQMNPV